MKQSVTLNTSQQLILTPRLQQAIQMLQLSTQELRQELEQTLETNIMLEMDDGYQEQTVEEVAEEEYTTATNDYMLIDRIPTDLPVDVAWNDIYESHGEVNTSEKLNNMEWQDHSNEGLRQHLIAQLPLLGLSNREEAIALILIDAIDEDGLLTISLEDTKALLSRLGQTESLETIQKVLAYLQQLGPAGIGARNVQECLLLQLQQLDADKACLDLAKSIITDHIDLLAKHDFKGLQRVCHKAGPQLSAAIQLIQSLQPRPGSLFSSKSSNYIIPDIFVERSKTCWKVRLNTDTLPPIRINHYYMALMRQAQETDTQVISTHLQEARWLLKCLHNRNETLLKVAACIIRHQQGFMEHGAEAMKPLVLRDIAEELSLHESTVSRITTNKYIHTPYGVFELKYFFSSHITTRTGNKCSAKAVRAYLQKLISNENKQKPLSDNTIAKLLSKQGVQVARRTIAKYREHLGILPASRRKQMNC